jgi:hypothetical protein
MVCMKRFDEYDQKYHIYLREIKTGLGENVALWVDDEIFPKENNQNFFFLK